MDVEFEDLCKNATKTNLKEKLRASIHSLEVLEEAFRMYGDSSLNKNISKTIEVMRHHYGELCQN